MQAIVQYRYGSPDVLEIADIPVPRMGNDEVLVRMAAASVDAGVGHLLTAEMPLVRLAFGLRRPRRRPGMAFAGTVEAVGARVFGLEVGQQVCGSSSGAFAELVTASAGKVAPLAVGVDPVAASTLPISGVTALQAVRDHGRVSAGQRVLVTGASGGVGTFAVQLARRSGADVTAVCGPAKVDLVRALGATRVIDYTGEAITGEYDVIIDIASPLTWRATRALLTDRGTLVIVGAAADHGFTGGLSRNLRASLQSPFTAQRLCWFVQKENGADLAVLAGLLASGALVSVVDRILPLAQTADALRYYLSGAATGKVVVTA